MSWRWLSQDTFGMWTVIYWTRCSTKQFGVSINVWRMAGESLNVTCNFLYCNHQVHRDYLITLYINSRRLELLLGLITFKPRYNVTKFIAHVTLWIENTSFTYLDLTPQITVNKQWILGTHCISYTTLVAKLTLQSCFSSVSILQARLSSKSLRTCSRRCQGLPSANCKKTEYLTLCQNRGNVCIN